MLPEPDATTTGSVTQTSSQPQAKTFIDAATAKQMDPDIVRMTERAARENPGLFAFNPKTKTLRTAEEQTDMVEKGWSKTQKSKHREGKAVDLVPINPDTGQPDPDYAVGYDAISKAMAKAAKDEGVDDYEWGGNWKSFQDKPHWQVSPARAAAAGRRGGLSPPVEQTVQPALFAEEGGIIPEPERGQLRQGWRGRQIQPDPRLHPGDRRAAAALFVPRRVGAPPRHCRCGQGRRPDAVADRLPQKPRTSTCRRCTGACPGGAELHRRPAHRRQHRLQPGRWPWEQRSHARLGRDLSGHAARQLSSAWGKQFSGDEGRTKWVDRYLTQKPGEQLRC